MKKSKVDYIVVAIGVLLLGVGLYLVKSVVEPRGFMRAFPYVCIGLGCGVFGHGMGNIISHKAIKTNPKAAKQLEIEQNDERNISISDKSKAKAYDIMLFLFGALLITFALMGIDTVALLLLVFAYVFVVGCAVYYRCKNNKEM